MSAFRQALCDKLGTLSHEKFLLIRKVHQLTDEIDALHLDIIHFDTSQASIPVVEDKPDLPEKQPVAKPAKPSLGLLKPVEEVIRLKDISKKLLKAYQIYGDPTLEELLVIIPQMEPQYDHSYDSIRTTRYDLAKKGLLATDPQKKGHFMSLDFARQAAGPVGVATCETLKVPPVTVLDSGILTFLQKHAPKEFKAHEIAAHLKTLHIGKNHSNEDLSTAVYRLAYTKRKIEVREDWTTKKKNVKRKRALLWYSAKEESNANPK